MSAELLLTLREREVLRLVAHGATYRGVAAELGISPKTIRNHLASLHHKLAVRNRAELTLAAVRMGLVEV